MNFRNLLLTLGILALAPGSRLLAQVYWSDQSPAGVADDIWSVTYANDTFAAVTSQGNLLTSANGFNWSEQSLDPGVWLVSIAYGHGQWVVVGDRGTILVSSDLKTWLNAKSATTNKLNGVAYNGQTWVAVGEGDTILSSPDAQTWTLQPGFAGFTGYLHGITFVPIEAATTAVKWISGGDFLVTGEGGAFGQLSPAGVPEFGITAATINGAVATTQNLEAVVIPPDQPGVAVAVGAVGATYAATFFETNFTVFSSGTLTPPVIYRGLAYGNGYYVAAGEQGALESSTDGKTWTPRFAGDSPTTVRTSTFLSAAYSDTLRRFVVTGTAGTIMVSSAAPTVLGNVSTRGFVSSAGAFIGGFVIQGSAARTVLIRADGPVLSTFSVPNPLPDPVLTVYDGTGTVVATNTGWSTNANPSALVTAALATGAFALPSASADSALVLTLPPGAYTAIITSAAKNSGSALFEAYTN